MKAFSIICSMAGKGANGIEVTWPGHSSGRKQVYSWVILLYSVCFYRNVPAAWSMRRHLNTFTHSSSLTEVKVQREWTCLLLEGSSLFSEKTRILISCFADASMYAHYLFNAFDTTNNGSIKFKVWICRFWYFNSTHGLYNFVYSGRRPECFVIGKGWFFFFLFLTEWTESVR